MLAEMQRSNERSMLLMTEQMTAQITQLREATLSKVRGDSQHQSTLFTERTSKDLASSKDKSANSNQDEQPAAQNAGVQHPEAEVQEDSTLPAAAIPDQLHDDIASDHANSETVKPAASELALANNDSFLSAVKDKRDFKSNSKSLGNIKPGDSMQPLLPQAKQDAIIHKRTAKEALNSAILFEPQTTVP